MRYIKNIGNGLWGMLVALDKFANALTGGHPEETVSSRMGRALSRDNTRCIICHWLCQGLNLIDPNHCRDAIKPRFREDEHRP